MTSRRSTGLIQLSMLFSALVLGVMALSMLLVFLGMQLLRAAGFDVYKVPVLLLAAVSLLLGALIALIFSRVPLRPIDRIIRAADTLAGGDFTVRVPPGGPGAFARLGESFNHLARELGSVEILRKDFINSFSHEFKTPIVSISGFARMLKRSDLTNMERAEYLDIIIRESDRLASLATSVLALSRLENQTLLTGVAPFNLTERLRRCVALLAGKWGAKCQKIVFNAPECTVRGDEETLNQVWINLLDNAIKFSPEKTVIEITLTQNADGVTIRIRDHGPGISAETAAHMFDRFYQGDASRATEGNGLGLTIVQRIARLHGGRIEAENAAGGGAVFCVVLPSSCAVRA